MTNGLAASIDRFFGVAKAGSTVGTEVRAGLTTFLTLAYILFVNPEILGKAISVPGVDVHGQLLVATALASLIGTLIMALWARYPFAVAPGMGLNAYFTYSVVLGHHIPWQTALGAVFISGLAFLLLSLVGVRQAIVEAIPAHLKLATSVGIGLFLAIIGCENAGLIQAHPATLVTLGDLTAPGPLLAIFGLILTACLLVRRTPGALIIGIAATTGLALATGAPVYGGQTFPGIPHGLLQAPAWPKDILFALDIPAALHLGLFGVVFIFLFVDLFDTAGSLMGLSQRGDTVFIVKR